MQFIGVQGSQKTTLLLAAIIQMHACSFLFQNFSSSRILYSVGLKENEERRCRMASTDL